MSVELLMRDIFKMSSRILNHELTTCFSPEKEGAQCPFLVEEGPCLEASFMGQVGPTNQPIGSLQRKDRTHQQPWVPGQTLT